MATLDDAYNQLVTANGHLTDLHNDVQAVKASTDAVNASVQAGFTQLDTLVEFTNKLLTFQIKQNDTIICNLEKITKQTCELVNQSTRQTVAEEAMREEIEDLEELFELANPEAAVEQHRLEELEAKVEECCPPKVPDPPCTYEPCPAPSRAPTPPRDKPPS
jgi:predicted nuclease with TOPRIM domain